MTAERLTADSGAGGGTDTADTAQRQALAALAGANLVTRGEIVDRLHDNVVVHCGSLRVTTVY